MKDYTTIALRSEHWHFPKPLKQKPVTLIVGIIAQDAIVFGSDSQTTAGDAKLLGTIKLHFIPFRDAKVILGEAGDAGIAENIIRRFRDAAQKTVLEEYDTPATLLTKAIRDQFHAQCEIYKSTPEKMKRLIIAERLESMFLLGYFHKQEPFLFVGSLLRTCVNRIYTHFTSIGVTSEVANHILENQTQPNMDLDLAAAFAIYAVSLANKTSAYCGNPIQVATLTRVPVFRLPNFLEHLPSPPPTYAARLLPQAEVNALTEIVRGVESQTNAKMRGVLNEQLVERTRQINEKLFPRLTDEQWKEILKNDEPQKPTE